MTKEEWADAQKRLSYAYGNVKLKIDGYSVTLVVEPSDKRLQYIIAVYVNGKIKKEWILTDDPSEEAFEIRSRFYQKHKKSLITPQQKRALKKESKEVQRFVNKMNREYIYFTPYWTSFRLLKSHFTKNNKSIELEDDNV